MNLRTQKWCVGVSLFAITVGVIACQKFSAVAQEPAKKTTKNSPAENDRAVQRTRKTVRMLDDLYKTTVVLITKTYVEDESSTPAATAAIALWEAMEKNGWHKVRLVDATGDPYDVDNVPKSAFEKASIKKLTAKDNYFDTVVTEKDGKRFLEAVTQVPVVMDKCKLCHPHYEDVAPGATIGAISYRIPIEE